MSTSHPDETLLSMYVADELSSREAQEVQEHLETCPQCRELEKALAQIPPALFLATQGRSAHQADRTFSRLRTRKHVGPAPQLEVVSTGVPADSRASFQPRQHRVAWALAATLLLGLGGGYWLSRHDAKVSPEFRTKGINDPAPDLRIHLLFLSQAPGGPLEPGRDRGEYPPDTRMFFRCQIPVDGHLALVRISNAGIEPLTSTGATIRSIPVAAGDWDLRDGERLLAYSLDDVAGAQRFLALFSPDPFELREPIISKLLSGILESELLTVHNLHLSEVTVTSLQ